MKLRCTLSATCMVLAFAATPASARDEPQVEDVVPHAFDRRGGAVDPERERPALAHLAGVYEATVSRIASASGPTLDDSQIGDLGDLPARIHVDLEKPFLLRFTNEVATTAGIGLLKNTPIADGASEIRIWLGFGVVVPGHMLRLQSTRDGEVTGELLVHFPSDTSYMGEYADAFHGDVMRHCRNLRRGGASNVCTATFESAPDWRGLRIKLVELGIETLPDESALQGPDAPVLDGVSLVVEVRDGASYRAYAYSNPAFRRGPEAKAASGILAIVRRVVRQSGGI